MPRRTPVRIGAFPNPDTLWRPGTARLFTHTSYERLTLFFLNRRIGMFALRDIAPGEELFFDYRYEKEKAPEWVDFDFDKQGGRGE